MPAPSGGAMPSPSQPEQAGCLGTIARIIWIMVGNFVLVVVLGLVVQRKSFSQLDVVFWVIVAALLFVRYADLKWLKGLGADAQPATIKDWVKYARLLVVIAGGAWVAVHALLLLLHR
jgi:hypothetical protein